MKKTKNGVVIYQAKSGAIELKGDFRHETIWATQAQITSMFEVDLRTISEHILNIYKSSELDEKATLRNFRIVQKEGKREIEREIKHYNLDLILSVGYRVSSKRATIFRQWATKTLRAHIVDGYTINKSRIAKNYEAFMESVEKIKLLLPASGLVDAGSALELIKMFAGTWISLHAYDTSDLPANGATKRQVAFTSDELSKALQELKRSQQDDSEFFGAERDKGSIASVVGNIFQSFGGKDLYPSVEEKAAHILYFIVKNHAFVDGNKRSGAFAFVWFLRMARILDTGHMTPTALTALTLLVAESDPSHKDRIIGLILLLLKK